MEHFMFGVRVSNVQFDLEFDLKAWGKTKDKYGLPMALPYKPANYAG